MTGGRINLTKKKETEKRVGLIIEKLNYLKKLRDDAVDLASELGPSNSSRADKANLLPVAEELSEFDFVDLFIWMKKIAEKEAACVASPIAPTEELTDTDKEEIQNQFEKLKRKLKVK